MIATMRARMAIKPTDDVMQWLNREHTGQFEAPAEAPKALEDAHFEMRRTREVVVSGTLLADGTMDPEKLLFEGKSYRLVQGE